MIRSRSAALLASVALAASAGTAQASVWTPIPSQTTDDITAVAYQSPTQVAYATAQGRIFFSGTSFSAPGRQFTDLAFRPSGDVALATADSGKLLRLANGAWTPVSLAGASFDRPGSSSFCRISPGPALPTAAPSATLLAVAWGSDSVAYAVSAADGQVLKSVDAGLTWKDLSRRADGTCKLPASLTDVATVPGSADDAFFAEDEFGRVWRTADGLATAAPPAPGTSLVNCFDVQMRLAFDANRLSLAGACAFSSLHWGASFDGGATGEFIASPSNGPLRDTAARGATMLAVGDAGTIEQSLDGRTSRALPADIAPNWRAVAMLDEAHAVVGGEDGALATTAQANAVEPTTPPAPAALPAAPVPITGSTGPTDARPLPTLTLTGKGAGATVRLRGGKVTITVRGRIKTTADCSGAVLLTLKKGKTLLSARTAKVNSKCTFTKRISLSRRKVGRAKTLIVTVRFQGNAALKPRSQQVRVRVRG